MKKIINSIYLANENIHFFFSKIIKLIIFNEKTMKISEVIHQPNLNDLDPDTFDQTDQGWRSLSTLRAQEQAIKSYISAHVKDGKLIKHNTGIYPTDIPVDPFAGSASLDYKTAEERGYFKIDLLNMTVYNLVQDPEHYEQLLAQEPPWERLWTDSAWAQQLVHVGNYTELLKTMQPNSIPRMAAFISIIRPGKAHLQTKPWTEVFQSVWDGDESRGYTFKKSHAVSYAALVALHMNLLNQDAVLA